jgi:hypothetical protein
MAVAMSVLGVAACAAPQAPAPVAGVKPCAAALSSPARKIYDAVQAGSKEGTLRERISSQTRDLVMEGEVKRSDARPSAEQAADCLKAP